jgi:hypothetical protein
LKQSESNKNVVWYGNELIVNALNLTINPFYGYIHIVKGKVYHPQMQAKVKRGHAPFKEAMSSVEKRQLKPIQYDV